jgi:hypothetical protein
MTGEILLSDIDLVKRLLSAGRLDAEIISILEHRGIAADRSVCLLADIKAGRPVSGADYLVIGKAMNQITSQPREGNDTVRTRSRKTSAETEAAGSRGDAPAPLSAPAPAPARRKQAPAGKRRGFPVVAVLIILLFGVAGYFGWRHFQRQQGNSIAPATDGGEKNGQVEKARLGKTGPLLAEITAKGMKLDGVLVTRSNVLETIRRFYGKSSRTNMVENKISYVYDGQGILLFCPQPGVCDSILFDYEGKGGMAGATSPFAGTIQVDDEKIIASTDSASLLGMKSLGLHQNQDSEKIFKADHGNVELYFAYFGATTRLSLTEITLKQ